MKKLAFISQKGGSGKTTSLLNLAVIAVMKGMKVLIVDLDPQASATVWYKARKAAGNGESPLVQPTHPAGLEDLMAEAAAQGVDWVLIDTAAGTDATASSAVEIADVVFVPCKASIMDLRAIPNSIRLCRTNDKTPNVVLTQIPTKGNLDVEAREQLRGIGVTSVLEEGVRQYAAFVHCNVDGRGVVEYEPNGNGAEDMHALFAAVRRLVDKSSSHLDGKKPSRRRTKKAS
jgi:chromosome partitioning protein